jgi:tetratricopeptide (TPR) repeat protein
VPPRGPGNLPRLLAHDKALHPRFGRLAREGAVADDILDVKDNSASVRTPADDIPEVAAAHTRAWAAFDAQDFDAALMWFERACKAAERQGQIAYKSENTMALVHAAMADWPAAMARTSRMKRLLRDAPEPTRSRFRMALHTNRGMVYSRRAARESDPGRSQRLFRLAYREHHLAAIVCLSHQGRLDTERAWNLADLSCRLGLYDRAAEILSATWGRDPNLPELLATHSRQTHWKAFLDQWHEDDGVFVPSRPRPYETS